jgi:hypothetical protein
MTTRESQARDSLRILVKHVVACCGGLIAPLFYGELAERIGYLDKHGRGQAHGMGKVLGIMGHVLKGLEGDWGEPIPHIQSLVVNKTGRLKDLPDTGIKEFWPDYPQMTREEKGNRTRIEHQRIVAFGSRWNDVLKKLSIPVVMPEGSAKAETLGGGGGGESPEHKRLKEYVRRHPEIVGATIEWRSFEEYPLPSLDVVDVLFKTGDACIAVEVKSRVSDGLHSDYERGLFQVVKYGALLRAMALSGLYGIPSRVESVLLLESTLPAEFRDTAEVLGVAVFENVTSRGPQ